MSLGQARVRVQFNPDHTSKIDRIKRLTATMIDEVHEISRENADPEIKRVCALAMTAYEEACMWAVKASVLAAEGAFHVENEPGTDQNSADSPVPASTA